MQPLSLAGQRVRAATRGSSHEKLKGVELVEVDYNKPETLIPAFKDADKLFLLTPASPNAAKLATNRQWSKERWN